MLNLKNVTYGHYIFSKSSTFQLKKKKKCKAKTLFFVRKYKYICRALQDQIFIVLKLLIYLNYCLKTKAIFEQSNVMDL